MNDIDSDDSLPEPTSYAPGSTTLWNNSWRRIFDQFGQAIIAYARRRGLHDHSAEDVLQEVMTTLIRCQHGQEPGHDRDTGSFQAWLWGVIKNRVRSVRRKDEKEQPQASWRGSDADGRDDSPALPEVSQSTPDPAESDDREWHRAMLVAALKKVQERVSPKNFAIYTALLEEKASPADLASRHAMKPNAIHQVKARCEEMVIREARAICGAWETLR